MAITISHYCRIYFYGLLAVLYSYINSVHHSGQAELSNVLNKYTLYTMKHNILCMYLIKRAQYIAENRMLTYQ